MMHLYINFFKQETVTHSSVADNCFLSFFEFEYISTVGNVGAQEVKFVAFISISE